MSGAPKAPISLLIIDDNLGSLELISNALAQPGLEIRLSAGIRKSGHSTRLS